jgi:hypothetical protein
VNSETGRIQKVEVGLLHWNLCGKNEESTKNLKIVSVLGENRTGNVPNTDYYPGKLAWEYSLQVIHSAYTLRITSLFHIKNKQYL